VGLGASLALNSVIEHWTAGDVRDPMMLGGVTVIFISVVIVASLIPARRPASIDPMRALRTD
jgi:ABC-type antimicrobial peptide transport system permease subunit